MSAPLPRPAGWFGDPSGRHRVRYWDGRGWTAWVADSAQPFVESPTAVDGAAPARSWPAAPLLWGMSLGACFGAAAVVAALGFPHRLHIGELTIGSGQRLGGVWWAVGVALALGLVASAALVARTPLRLVPAPAPRDFQHRWERLAAFATSFTLAFGVGALSAIPTWVQDWPAIFALATLVALVVAGVAGATIALRLRPLQQSSGPLRSRNWLSAIRGQLSTESGT